MKHVSSTFCGHRTETVYERLQEALYAYCEFFKSSAFQNGTLSWFWVYNLRVAYKQDSAQEAYQTILEMPISINTCTFWLYVRYGTGQ